MAYIKPQSPLKLGEDHLYPLTTYDQIIMEDGNRWDGKSGGGELDVDLTGASQGAIALTNADLLGGVAAKNYMLKTDTAQNSEKLGGKAPQYYIQPRNLLDNSDFTNPINQRGQTSYSTEGYTIDRWKISSSLISITKNNNSITINNTDTNNRGRFEQRIENGKIKSNKTYTFAIGFEDGSIYCDSAILTQTDGSNGWYLKSIGNDGYGRFYYTGSFFEVAIVIGKGESLTIKWIALYEGSYTIETLPPYVPKGYAVELAECQRYYIHGVGAGCVGYGISGQNYLITFIPTPVEMRANPVLVIDTQDNVVLYNNIIAVTGVNNALKRSNGVLCNFTLASNFPTHGTGTLGGSTSINFIADL